MEAGLSLISKQVCSSVASSALEQSQGPYRYSIALSIVIFHVALGLISETSAAAGYVYGLILDRFGAPKAQTSVHDPQIRESVPNARGFTLYDHLKV